MTYEQAIDYLESANVFGTSWGSAVSRPYWNGWAIPRTTIRPSDVTGTNGKGSVTAMIASVLTEAGFRTGRYTSPHLEDYTERIHIDNHDIPATTSPKPYPSSKTP